MPRAKTQRFATLGVVENANTAILVTVDDEGNVVDRREIRLTEPGMPTHPHHHEGSWSVGRYLDTPGARRMSLDEAVALVARVRTAAEIGARTAFDALTRSIPIEINGIALRAFPPLPETTIERIRDHRAQTYADSATYREAMASAARELGWVVHWYDKDRVFDDAARVLGSDDADEHLASMGRLIGPPWRANHKLAAAAAIAAQIAGSSKTRRAR